MPIFSPTRQARASDHPEMWGGLRDGWRVGSVLVKVLIVLVVLAAAGVAAAVMARGGGHDEAAPADVYKVTSKSFQITTTANGELQAKRETKLRSELDVQASIVTVVDEGKYVMEGDLLIKLSDEEIKKQLEEEQLRVASAEADLIAAENAYDIQLSDNDSALRQATLNLDLAEIELRKWQLGDLQKRRQELAQSLEAAELESNRATEKLERSHRLFERGFLSSDELERDRITEINARAAFEKAKLEGEIFEEYEYHKDNKRLTSDVEEKKAELSRVERRNASQLASKEADLNNKRAQLNIRNERLAKLKDQLAATEIKAPTDGLVVYASSIGRDWRWDDRGPMAVGRNVYPNEELIVLPDTQEMMAQIKIHESQISRISKGMRARVKVEAADGKIFEGAVEEIGILAESGGWRDPNLREYEVKIRLENTNSDDALKPSMRCEATVIIDEVNDKLALPIHAVFYEGKVQYVYRDLDGSKYERTPVVSGRRSDAYVEILDGLSEGDLVLLREPSPGRVLEGELDSKAYMERSQKILASNGNTRRGGRAPSGEMAADQKPADPGPADAAVESVGEASNVSTATASSDVAS